MLSWCTGEVGVISDMKINIRISPEQNRGKSKEKEKLRPEYYILCSYIKSILNVE